MSKRSKGSPAEEPGVRPDVPDLDLIRPVGRGGFGEVWLARSRITGHLRAVKLIPLRGLGTTDRAGREITSLTRLEASLRRQHPHLLTIHHLGKTADHLFYVMDPADDVSGNPASADPAYRPATLQERLKGGPLSLEECLSYARQVLTGLAWLHEAGMVHRDVKPANCLFVAGELKLADFGLLTEVHPQVSRMGTEKYMPPDGRMDTRADVYAAGLVIYELLSGLPADRFPCLGERARELNENTTLSRLIRLVLRACRADPEHRFQDAGRMLAALERCRSEAGVRRVRSRRLVVVSLASMVAAVSLAAVGWWATRPLRVQVNFISEKPFFDAEIYLDGRRLDKPDGTPHTTPCTVKNLPARVHRVVFRHEGLHDLDAGEVDFATKRQVAAYWSSKP